MFLGVVLLVAVAAASPDACQYGDWGQWSDCERVPACEPKIASWQEPSIPRGQPDKGREAMQRIRAQKMRDVREMQQCVRAGTCPEKMMRPNNGAATCTNNNAAGYPCNNINLESFINITSMHQNVDELYIRGNDMWGWTDSGDGNKEYAIYSLYNGVAFVEVTDPRNPRALGVLLPENGVEASNWGDVKTIGNYAYIVSEATDHGLQIFDLTGLRGLSTDSSRTFTATNTVSDFSNAHNIVADPANNMVYAVGDTRANCIGGLRPIDVSDPLNPVVYPCFDDDGYVHDAECKTYNGPDSRYTGRQICYCLNEDSVTLVDVTDKNNMQQISRSTYATSGYTHQGVTSVSERYLFVNDEQDESRGNHFPDPDNTRTFMWDISDMQNPSLVLTYKSDATSIDHNMYVNGSYLIQANYQAGLRILRINETEQSLTEVAYFDVYPDSTEVAFNGAWSCYPYYRSGAIAISSIEYGLFMVRPDWAAIGQVEGPHGEQTRSRSANGGASCVTKETRKCPTPKCR